MSEDSEDSNSLLRVRELSLQFASQTAALLENASFTVKKGQFWSFLGANGSGKSTLLKWVTGNWVDRGLLSSGRRELGGVELQSMTGYQRAQRVAYLGSAVVTDFEVTVSEYIKLGRLPFTQGQGLGRVDCERVEAAIKKMEIAHLANRDLRTLSGGERQLASLARAFCTGAPLLVLDESLSQLDLDHQWQMMDHLNLHVSQGGAVMLVAHDWNLALRKCTHLAWLFRESGKFLAEPYNEATIEPSMRAMFPNPPLKVARVAGARPVVVLE